MSEVCKCCPLCRADEAWNQKEKRVLIETVRQLRVENERLRERSTSNAKLALDQQERYTLTLGIEKQLRADLAVAVEALEQVTSVPYELEPATIPKAGIEAAPDQVVGTLHMALTRYRKIQAAIARLKGGGS